MKRRRKPDWLMVLFVAIGLGVVVTGYAFDMGASRDDATTFVNSK